MLRHRLLAAIVLVVVLGLALWVDWHFLHDSLLFHLFFLIGVYFAAREFWPLCRATGHQTFSNWGTLSPCALVAAHYYSMHLANPHEARIVMEGALVIAVLGAFLLSAFRHDYKASLGGLGVTCLGLLYLWYLPSFLLKIRHMGSNGLSNGVDWNTFGHKLTIATIVVAKGCDVWAYLIGRKWGTRKVFPNLSPGKTLEGGIAGLMGSVLLAFVLRWEAIDVLPARHFDVWGTALFGLLVGFAGMMGDLSESLLKRSAGVKDASQLVPGYGGLLDVMDSLVVAAPVAYFLIPVMLAV
jgi:phosphatidate cytidylyltransferase